MRFLLSVFIIFIFSGCAFLLCFICPKGKIVFLEIQSSYLSGNLIGDSNEKRILVYLPPGYSQKGKRFPVLYVLPGFDGDEESYLKALGKRGFICFFDSLIKKKEIIPMIVVIPNGKTFFGGSFYASSEVVGDYESYIVKEVVTTIDENFKTIPSFEYRIVAGGSMGGYGAMRLAMKYPQIFGGVVSLSSPLDLESAKLIFEKARKENKKGEFLPKKERYYTRLVFALSSVFSPNPQNPPFFVDLPFDPKTGKINKKIWKKWQRQNLIFWIEKHKESLRKMRIIYIDVSRDDEFGLYEGNLRFHRLLNSFEIKHDFVVWKGSHKTKPLKRAKKALISISRSF